MTFKEKLAKEHPSKVIDTAVGGCLGCPHDYDYEKYSDNEEFCASREPVEEHCRECWNREIPETEKTKSTGFGIKDFIKAAIELKKNKRQFRGSRLHGTGSIYTRSINSRDGGV